MLRSLSGSALLPVALALGIAPLARAQAPLNAETTESLDPVDSITATELDAHIRFLADDALEGRGSGTPGERKAAQYMVEAFQSYGLQPAGVDGTFFQPFQIANRPQLDPGASFRIDVGNWYREFAFGEDVAPFGFSGSGQGQLPLVFAGYGVTDPSRGYDDYAGLDVTGKAVIVLRWEPNPDPRNLSEHAYFVTKAQNAQAHGAAAVILVNGPVHQPGDDALVPAGGQADITIPVVMARQSLLEGLFDLEDLDLAALQRQIDETLAPASCALESALDINLSMQSNTVTPRNVLAMLPGSDPELAHEVIVIGGHYDHLGYGHQGGSLGGGSAIGQIHNGADDNASGSAAVLELAQAFALNPPRRSILFMGFSGEERGLLGSAHFVAEPTIDRERIVAMINLDMVGRLRDQRLEVGGVDTSPTFRALVQAAVDQEGLQGALSGSGTGPSDHASFYRAQIPVLFLFTGLHSIYHTPADDPDTINTEGAESVARVAYRLGRAIADADDAPAYNQSGPAQRPVIGIAPDRNFGGPGVRAAQVTPRGPAQRADMQDGDVIVALGDHEVEDLQDLVDALGNLAPGDEVDVALLRGEERLVIRVTLGAR